jgi:hypothetical protein
VEKISQASRQEGFDICGQCASAERGGGQNNMQANSAEHGRQFIFHNRWLLLAAKGFAAAGKR